MGEPLTTSPPFLGELGGAGDDVAVIVGERRVTYAELESGIERQRDRLGHDRRLVWLEGANDLECLTIYLAALRSRQPVIVVKPGDESARLRDLYRPDTVVTSGPAGWTIEHRRRHTEHELHPDLALLLSTSGSTGAAKFVRLSHANLAANAASIAEYLSIRPDDRAVTALPLHYCYGLSVVHSHLLVGATVVLTDRSVTDPDFWDLLERVEATTFPAVPYTFELLERIDFERRRPPSLRYLTQAGGKLAPELVRKYALLGREQGWDLFVMYGATEATARMAYLPPELAADHPTAIGRAIPGGELRLADDGELVYRGPNVMLGYATEPAHLADGATLDELRTGDLARLDGDGLFEIVGRKSRFLKLFGLRISLDEVERIGRERSVELAATGGDDGLVVATPEPAGVVAEITERFGLPASAVAVVEGEVPRLANGKVDYPTIRASVPAVDRRAATADGSGERLRRRVARLLGVDEIGDDDSFVGLGGDSLSYIEVGLELEEALGDLPDHWHRMTFAELEQRDTEVPGRLRTVETNVALRAAAIVAVIGDHLGLWALLGGAHVLLAVSGYNFSRFALPAVTSAGSVRPLLASIGRIVAPTLAWLVLVMALNADPQPEELLLVSSYLPGSTGGYWYIEVLVQMLLVLAAVLAVPPIRRVVGERPLAAAGVAVGAGLVGRYGVHAVWDTAELGYKVPHLSLWLFAYGWLAHQATDLRTRAVLSVVAVASVPGLFDDTGRNLVIAGGVLLLIWVPRLPMPAPLHRLVAVLGGASLYLYLVHLQVVEVLDPAEPIWGMFAALVAGLAAAAVAERLMPPVERWLAAAWRRRARG